MIMQPLTNRSDTTGEAASLLAHGAAPPPYQVIAPEGDSHGEKEG